MILPDRRAVLAGIGGLAIAPGAWTQGGRIPFEHANGKIFAPALLNGRPVQAVLDSGSAFLGVDQRFAAEAGVQPRGRRTRVRGVQHVIEGRGADVASLDIGGRRLAGLQALVVDYASLVETVGRPVEVALGRDFFSRFVVDLDFERGTFALHDPQGFAPPTDATEVRLMPRAGLMPAPVVMPGGRVIWALVDTGSDSPLIVSPGVANRLRLFRGRSTTAPLGGIGGGTVARIASVPRITFGGVAFEDVPVQAPPRGLGVDANLGLGILGRFHLWIDFPARRLWVRPGGEQGPFRRDLLGFYGRPEGAGIRVTHVAPGGPAQASGFRTGELITAINGLPAAQANQAFREAAAGTTLAFALSDGRVRRVTLARYY